jgi:hypothetical protein
MLSTTAIVKTAPFCAIRPEPICQLHSGGWICGVNPPLRATATVNFYR